MLRKPLLLFTVIACCPISYCSNMIAWGWGANTNLDVMGFLWLIVPYLICAVLLMYVYNLNFIVAFTRPENAQHHFRIILGGIVACALIALFNLIIGSLVFLLLLGFCLMLLTKIIFSNLSIERSRSRIHFNLMCAFISYLVCLVAIILLVGDRGESDAYGQWLFSSMVGYFAGLTAIFLISAYWHRAPDG